MTGLYTLEVGKTNLQQTEMEATDTARLDHIQDADRFRFWRVANIPPITGMDEKPYRSQ